MCKLLLLFMVTTIAQRPLLVGGFFHRSFHFLKLASSSGVKVKSLSHVRLFATPRNVAYQAPPSMEFFRQEYWSGLPFPSPGDLPDPGMNPGVPHCRQTLHRLSLQGKISSGEILLKPSTHCTSPKHLSHASNLGCWSVSPWIIYMSRCCSLEISHPCLLPQSPKVCSVPLCLFSCFAYRIIITIFLNSIYMH